MRPTRWLLCALLFACGPQIPFERREKVVLAIYDPARADLPTPNDLAMKDGRVAIEPNGRLSDAENELKLSFNGYRGFSPYSSARIQFSAPLSAASIDERTVVALDLGEGGKGTPTPVEVRREYAACDSSISLFSPTGFTRGHVYLFAVRGGDDGLKGQNGERVAPSPAFHFLRAGEDLTEHPDAFPGATRAEKRATAERLEAVRQSLEPYFQVLERHGLPRREVAALWTFTARVDGELFFDPGSKKIPFPNDLLRDGQGRVSLPIDPSEKPESQALKRAFNELDGFSVTAALSVEATLPLDRSTVSTNTVRLFRADTIEPVDDIDVELSTDGRKVTVQPKTPLRPATRYVVVLHGLRDVEGRAVAPMPLASLLMRKHPLAIDGRSTISSLCDDTAAHLEGIRAAMAPVLDRLEASGVKRADVSTAYAFTTLDIQKRVRELWNAPYDANLPLEVTDRKTVNPPITMPDVSKIIGGKLTTLDFLDPTTRAFRAKGQPAQIELVLTLPKGMPPGASAPVVVFGHGLNTERRLSLFVANRLARSGFATIAIDFPYHGERTVCTQSSHCSGGATCAKDGTCVGGGLARLPNIFPIGEGTPTATGAAFVDVENLAASRDHFRQAFVDLSALTRLIREMDWKMVTGGYGLDGERLHYVGISLGGIVGASESGIDPHFRSMLLNVPGAGLVDLMRESLTFGPMLEQGLNAKGIRRGSPEYQSFVNAARWLLDEVDPLNLSVFAFREPFRYVDPRTKAEATSTKKRLRIQMAVNDTVVPNASTMRLVTASGVDKDKEFRSFLGTHGFLADPVEPAFYAGQEDMASFLEGKP